MLFVFRLPSLLGSMAVLISAAAHAAEYSLDSDYGISARYNDNYRLALNPKSEFDELSGADFSADYSLARNTEVSSLSTTLDLDAGSYNLDAFNTFDQRLASNYRRNYERGSWNFGASFNNDSVTVTEATTGASGRFTQTDERSRSLGLNAGWFSQLTERHSFNWSAFGTRQRYDSDSYTDYKYAGASVLWQFMVQERLRLQTQLGYNALHSEDDNLVFSPLIFDADALGIDRSFVPLIVSACQNFPDTPIVLGSTFECLKNSAIDNEQSTVTTQLGVYYAFSENLLLDVLVGQSTTDTDSVRTYSNRSAGATDNVPDQTIKRKNDNTTYTASLVYDAENLEYTLLASSRDSANSTGVLTLNRRLAFDTDWRPDARNGYLLRLSWLDQQSSSDDDAFFLGREYYEGLVRYSRRLNEDWTMSGTYRYIDLRRAGVKEHANSNQVALALTWRPTTLKWSR
ncbi:MAG: hypothetical protein KJO62_05025 [Gammaproteobacteria bacterium]|nr:hypothetical protein [Gammaproteobacteria bacterium]